MVVDRVTFVFFISSIVFLCSYLWLFFKFESTEFHDDISYSYLFNLFDSNHDSFLGQEEFNEFMEYFEKNNINSNEKYSDFQDYKSLSPTSHENAILLQCSYKPIVLSHANERIIDKNTNAEFELQIKNLETLKETVVNKFEVASKYLSLIFKPPELKVGTIWWIIQPNKDKFQFTLDQKMKLEKFHAILTMFHPRPVLLSKFMPQGCTAIVNAINETFVDITFRLHADFKLNKPGKPTFWLSPSQFCGKVTFHLNDFQVVYFMMKVPNDRSRNVEMEWKTEEKGLNSVDISYIPEMKIESQIINHHHEIKNNFSNSSWNDNISEKEAFERLHREMYPYAQVYYHPLDEVMEIAKMQSKLIHSVILAAENIFSVAGTLLKVYTFPAICAILSPEGKLLHYANLNDLLQSSVDSEIDYDGKVYAEFLLRGLEMWKQSQEL
ncbi:Selenoprotein N [Nymphon striatum]|nr:Selenoprotein N [Nymphon striatum]